MTIGGRPGSSTAADNHRIAVFAVPDDIVAVEDVLSRVPGMDSHNIRHIVRSMPGLIPVSLARIRAADIASAIRELGVFAASIPETDLPDISPGIAVRHVDMKGRRVTFTDATGKSQSWPCRDIGLISAGAIVPVRPKLDVPATRIIDGLPRGTSPPIHDDSGIRNRLQAIVVLRGGIVMQLVNDRLSYTYLGDRVTQSPGNNFTTFIRDLSELAVDAWPTPSARSLVQHAPLRHYEFRTNDDFERYTQFQLLLKGPICAGC